MASRSQTRPLRRHADHIETALETSCGVLVTLESFRAGGAAPGLEMPQLQRQLREAIDSVRHVITELRAALDGQANMLSLGFVVDDNHR